MLIITRRLNDSLICELPNGESIILKVVAIHGKQIRLGINAPNNVTVLRDNLRPHEIEEFRSRNSLSVLRSSLIAFLFTLFAISSTLFAQTITVTSPNGGETWKAGEARDVTWTSTGTFANVRIEISFDGGATFPTVLASGTTNDGSKGVTVPNTPSITCRVRITNAASATPTDISNNNFTITGTVTPPPPARDSLWVISPNGSEKLESSAVANITFGKQGSIGSVRLELSTDNGASWQFIGVTPNNNFLWTMPQFISPVCLLRIADQNDGVPLDMSDRVFSIVAPVKRSKLIVSWNPNFEEDLAGYWVYYGTNSRQYPSALFISDSTLVIDNLLPATYYIAVTAIDESGNESGFSNEVSAIIESGQTDTTPPQVPAGVNVTKQ